MFAEIVKQIEQAELLAARAQRAVEKVRGLRSGDRVYTPLVASAEFYQGSSPSANLVFNVPADADFWAYRLLLYPYCKVVDPVNGTPDEVVFRSTSFTGQPFNPGWSNPADEYSDFTSQVDGTFALIFEGKELQNIDTPFSAAYCSTMGKWRSSGLIGWAAASQTPAGMVFDIPFFIARSKSLTCRITPTYLGQRAIEEVLSTLPPTTGVRQHRYKIVGVLEGEKKVTAFR